jgi:hypothetical protein
MTPVMVMGQSAYGSPFDIITPKASVKAPRSTSDAHSGEIQSKSGHEVLTGLQAYGLREPRHRPLWRTRNVAGIVACIAVSAVLAFFSTLTQDHGTQSCEFFLDKGFISSAHMQGITDQVQWDNYSLILRGQRIFIKYVPCPPNSWFTPTHCLCASSFCSSGEFHPWRLPVRELWPDILQKFKAAGFNAVSIYTHMGLINPAPGVIDMDGWRSVESFFDTAKNAGLWVVLRPGL